jgi:acetylornithine deacetylase/succinyl-diaminopimelate desuccinylase-like protein
VKKFVSLMVVAVVLMLANTGAAAALRTTAAATIGGMDQEVLVAPYLLQGWTDAECFYALSDNVYRFLMFRATPGTLNYVRGIDEHVTVGGYLQAIRFYYHLIRQSMTA